MKLLKSSFAAYGRLLSCTFESSLLARKGTPTLIPSSSFFDFASSSIRLRPSTVMRNKNCERGSPWRSPHRIGNSSVGEPFIRTDTEAEERHSEIQLIHVWLKPIFAIISKRKSHLTQSNAFSKSTLNARLPDFLFFIKWSISLQAMMLSVMFLPPINADCAGLISFSIKSFNLFARHLERIL